jgi:hypothetical protein
MVKRFAVNVWNKLNTYTCALCVSYGGRIRDRGAAHVRLRRARREEKRINE